MDKKYWNNYYHQHGKDQEISICSTFADFCVKQIFPKKSVKIVELGSGNGRDAIHFAHQKMSVIAIDQSTAAIDIEKKELHHEAGKYLHPKALDFVREDYSKYGAIDIFYSRFTIHSITKEEEELLLPNIYQSLKKNGLFCIEVRTIKDPLYGVGECCGENTYKTDHKRRFINSKIFLEDVLRVGFELVYFIEKNDLSVYADDNPVLMRIILKK
ncbi:MAG: class I SAM-dependent methyltransferase [Gammaproteobacteria bacterium]|nr:class I SAM-dependent methyltransferase [Gammaproteobacteria bacterium]